MRLFTLSRVLGLLYITGTINALPYEARGRNERQFEPRAPTYSVVPVEGGSTAPAAATQTVVEPVTRTVATTIYSTVVITESETPMTIVFTFPTVAFQASTPTTSTDPPATVTVTMPVSMTPYDDGMWHSWYYHPVTLSTSVITPSADPSTSTSSFITTALVRSAGSPSNGPFAVKPRQDKIALVPIYLTTKPKPTTENATTTTSTPPLPTLPKLPTPPSDNTGPNEVPTIDVADNLHALDGPESG